MSLEHVQHPARPRVAARRLQVPAVLLYGSLLFVWGSAVAIAHDWGMTDESWFLQVARRVAGGEVLYRDVFFGATPLSVYLTTPFVRLLGAEILVTKALLTLYFVATVLLTVRIVRQLGATPRPAIVLPLVLLATLWPRQSAGYNPLATVLLLACWSATLDWAGREQAQGGARQPATDRRLMWSGLLAGLCFGAKQNVGVYALGALGATVILLTIGRAGWRRATPRHLLVVAGAFTLAVVVVLAPIVVSGGFARFVDYGFTNKRTYLDVGGLSYVAGLRGLLTRARTFGSVIGAQEAYLHTLYVVPPLVLALLLAAVARTTGAERRRAGVVLLFTGAMLAGVYPRPDVEHLIYAVPGLAIGAAYAASRLRLPTRAARTAVRGAVLLWGVLGFGLLLTNTLDRGLSPRYGLSTLPHFRGVLIEHEDQASLQRYADALAASAGDRPMFLLSPYASFFYLVSGVDNPTPFDYPLVTAFGLTGQDAVMRSIEDGSLPQVCVRTRRAYTLRPASLIAFVQERMRQEHAVGFCTIFRGRP